MAFGKVIKLFLLDGSPNKRWICELSNWTGVAYKIPRNMVKESEDREELSSPGIYFLFGYDDDREKPLIYVGEAENIIKRLKEHIARKDNWIQLFAFFLVSIYWFHPLVWLSYFAMIRDMEMSCDEYVMSKSGKDIRAVYGRALLGGRSS